MRATELASRCWRHDPSRYASLHFGPERFGFVLPHVADVLRECPSVTGDGDHLDLGSLGANVSDRTELLVELSEVLRSHGAVPPATGELYEVRSHSRGRPLAQVDRSAAIALGIQTYGVHLNAYACVVGETEVWVATRSRGKRYFPGQLDNLVAGGQPAGSTPLENLAKEAYEEAGLTSAHLAPVESVKALSYRLDTSEGLVDSVIDVFDLELPPEFVPTNQDGEVEAFTRHRLGDLAELVLDERRFKFNSALVVVDFLRRRRVPITSSDEDGRSLDEYLARPDPRMPSIRPVIP